MKRVTSVLLAGLILGSHALPVIAELPFQPKPQLIIILDDIGNNQTLGQRAVNLPAPVTLAFLPFTPFAARLAERANQQGHGIMLHAPMANESGAKLGPGALTPDMDRIQLQQTLSDSLQAIPHVQGINNHMGSLLTQQPDAMTWVMEVLAEQDLYFVDSLTSPLSVAAENASEAGIPTVSRDVFLDNKRSEESLNKQFNHALSVAKRRGYAVLIGHPYPETLTYLEQRLPTVESEGVELQGVDHYFLRQQWRTPASELPLVSRYQLLLEAQ